MVRSIRSPDNVPASAPAVPICAHAGNSRPMANEVARAPPPFRRWRRSSKAFSVTRPYTQIVNLTLEHGRQFLPSAVNSGFNGLAANTKHGGRLILAQALDGAKNQRLLQIGRKRRHRFLE